jgi:protein TonB
MRCFYLITAGLVSGLAWSAAAQELPSELTLATDSVSYYPGVDTLRVNSQTDSVGTCVEVLRWGASAGLARLFYSSGHLKEYMPYSDVDRGLANGLATSWFDSGQLHTRQVYTQGRRTGTLSVYYETGALKRQVDYVAGTEQIGSCFDPEGKPVAYFPYEQLPLYPGGEAQLTKEIFKELRLPSQLPLVAYVRPLQVEVMLRIAEDGSISTPLVARSSVLKAFDQAVLTAISKLSRRFSPGRRDGQLVVCNYYLPVQLRVPLP